MSNRGLIYAHRESTEDGFWPAAGIWLAAEPHGVIVTWWWPDMGRSVGHGHHLLTGRLHTLWLFCPCRPPNFSCWELWKCQVLVKVFLTYGSNFITCYIALLWLREPLCLSVSIVRSAKRWLWLAARACERTIKEETTIIKLDTHAGGRKPEVSWL